MNEKNDDVILDGEPVTSDETDRERKKRLKKQAKEAKKANRAQKYKEKSVFKETLLALFITLVLFVISEYFTLTPINFRSQKFLITLPWFIGLFIILRLLFLHRFGKSNFFLIGIIVICLVMNYAGPYFSSRIFFAKKYANQISLKKSGDFYKDMKNVTENSVPTVDKGTAIELGDKNMGTIPDYVSQFKVDQTYNQINYRGRAVRVTMLTYGNTIKWLTNHFHGLPAYIKVDMVSQNTDVVKLKKPIRFSKSDKMFRDINRYIRFRFPFLMFDSPSFELNEKGTPYWVAPVYTYKIGLFGGKDIIGAITVDATSGKAKYYRKNKVPEWVDRVYPAALLMKQLKNTGRYSHGYLNTLFSQKGVLKPTSGYNYLAIGKDIWMYTGLTSVTGDSSNVGFALINMRTKEAKFYSIPGATESSAMKSAAGKVQEQNYKPTFPTLLNVENTPAYFLSLKDQAGLVKQYAFVSVEHYEIVGIGDSVKTARESYLKQMSDSGHLKDNVKTGTVTGKINTIRSVVVNGNTTYYISLKGHKKQYITAISLNDQLPTLKSGDKVTITYEISSKKAVTTTQIDVDM